MMTIYLATSRGISTVQGTSGAWSGWTQLKELQVECVRAHPREVKVAYCGTFGRGLYKTSDEGRNWFPCQALGSRTVSALALDEAGIIYAGTEPSQVFRSEDDGLTWTCLPPLTGLPSSREWSFPPRPHTHHVKALLPDPCHPGELLVAIEAGALVRSSRARSVWDDRVHTAPRDTHWLLADRYDPGKLYSAAGDGFFQSEDDGETWQRVEDGLDHRYCWSLVGSLGPSDVQVMSAASDAFSAHYERFADSFVYRREKGGRWQRLGMGLPDSLRHRAAVIARSLIQPKAFCLATEGRVFLSEDEGRVWNELSIDWLEQRAAHAVDIAVL